MIIICMEVESALITEHYRKTYNHPHPGNSFVTLLEIFMTAFIYLWISGYLVRGGYACRPAASKWFIMVYLDTLPQGDICYGYHSINHCYSYNVSILVSMCTMQLFINWFTDAEMLIWPLLQTLKQHFSEMNIQLLESPQLNGSDWIKGACVHCMTPAWTGFFHHIEHQHSMYHCLKAPT